MAVDVFQPYTNPISGETFRCISFDERAFVMEWTVQPRGYVPFEHVHLRQDEIFHIEQGVIRLRMDGREIIAGVGESIVVPMGSRHIAFNEGGDVLKCIVEYRPGLDQLKLTQCFAGLLIDGEYNRKGEISIPKMGFFLKHMNCQAMTRPTNIPGPALGLALNTFYLLGLARGWKRDFLRYTGEER